MTTPPEASPWVLVRKGLRPVRFPSITAAAAYFVEQPWLTGDCAIFGPGGQCWRHRRRGWFNESRDRDAGMPGHLEPE